MSVSVSVSVGKFESECVCVCFSERLVREREILEERAERRLEIFKNLIDKMASAGPSPDTAMVTYSLCFLGD